MEWAVWMERWRARWWTISIGKDCEVEAVGHVEEPSWWEVGERSTRRLLLRSPSLRCSRPDTAFSEALENSRDTHHLPLFWPACPLIRDTSIEQHSLTL